MLSDFASTLPSKSVVLKKALWPKKLIWMRLLLVIGILFSIRFGVMLVAVGRESQTDWLTESVRRTTVPMTIVANGTVEGARTINLSPKTAGVIEALRVAAGDPVQAGQVVAIMDDADLRGELLQGQGQLAEQQANLARLLVGDRPEEIAKAAAQLAEAEANLQELQAGNRSQDILQASARLQQAQATHQQRETALQRYELLYRQGAISQEDLDQKRADREVAKAQVREANEALALLTAGTRPEQVKQAAARVEQQRQTVAALRSGNRSEDIDQARAQVQAAQGALQIIEAKLQDTRIVAPFDGVVNEIYAEIGSFVSPSMSGGNSESSSASSILMLSSARNQVVVNLPESQIARVEIGQSVSFKADAFPGKQFTGKVEHIAARASVNQNVTSFEVRVSIDTPTTAESNANLKIGMNVEAEFEVGRLANVLLVPNAAVVRKPEGEGVYILGEDRKPVFQAIQTGVTAGAQTEVKSGLVGNEQVLISPPPETEKSGGFGFPPAPQ